MEIKEFEQEIFNLAEKIGIQLKSKEIELFCSYMKNLLEWNTKINLTAITEQKEIILKHFIDSLTIHSYIEEKNTIMDVGTGAGFPGIPIKIIKKDCNITLLDSLNKRIMFLRDSIDKLGLEHIEAVHARAEEVGREVKYREKYDIVVSRAVAPLNILVEYLIPFVKVGGKVICMKGPKIEEELKQAQKAINQLGGTIDKIDNLKLPDTEIERNIILIKKWKNTPKEYPRKAGIPSKNPIV